MAITFHVGKPGQGMNLATTPTKKPGNPRFPWVVVESPGTEFEKIVYTASRFEIARNWMERHYTDDYCPADVMKRDRSGNLTTEF